MLQKMVKICQMGLLKLNFEIIPNNAFSGFAKNFRRPWMKVKNFFCQFPNPWVLRVSGMGCFTSKCAPLRPPPPPQHLGSYTRVLLVSQERRHLFVNPWLKQMHHHVLQHRQLYILVLSQCAEKKIKGRLVDNVIYTVKRFCETCWVLLYTKSIFYRTHYCEYPGKANRFQLLSKKRDFLKFYIFYSLIHLKVLSSELDPAEIRLIR